MKIAAPLSLKKLTAGGGVLIGLGLLIGMIGNLWIGMGGGGNGAGGDAPHGQQAPPAQNEQDDATQRDPAITEPDPEPNRDQTSSDVLEVLIDGREYFVRTDRNGQTELQSMELSEIAERAQSIPGNEEGIRVRILRRETSRASAEELLQEELRNAGLPREAIHMVPEVLP